MSQGKSIAKHSKITAILAMFFVATFSWQVLAMEAVAAVQRTPVAKFQVQTKGKIHRQLTPTLPDLAMIYIELGLRSFDLQRWQEAIEAFGEAISIRPDYEVAHFSLGMVYSRVGVWQEALGSFKKVVEISPDYAAGYLGLGIAYTALGQSREAMEACRKAIRIKPGYAQAHYTLALNFLMLGDKASALKEYGIIKNLDQNLAEELISVINK